MKNTDTIDGLMQKYRTGVLSRRTFMLRAAALGLSLPMAAALAGMLQGAAAAPGATGGLNFRRAQDGGVELTVAHVEEPDTLDPHNLTAAAAGLVGYVVMPGLVWWDYELGVSPMIAESWETSEDGLTWTFTIRPNLVFHNGKACTAQEVVRNFEHIRDPEASFLAPDFEAVASVEAPDETTVVFTLSAPFAPFLAVLTNRCAITDMDAYDANTPVGVGPFKILAWQRGSGLTLEAHDAYFEEGLPLASKVNWRFIPEAEPRLLAIQGGEVDIITELPSSQIDSLQSSGEIMVEPIQGVTHQYLAFNCAEGPFSDVRARKAVAHAIDKEVIVEGAWWGYATVTNIPFPPSSPWYVEIPDYEYDPELAKSLLAEAGLGDGIDVDFPIPNWSPASTVAEIIQADLANVGINLRLLETEWATYWPETYLKSQFQFTFMGYSARVDPDQTFYPRYHSTGVHNATRYSNARVDELLDQGRQVTVQEERKVIYDEVQQILVDELPWIWLYLPDVTNGWTPNVAGFRQHPGYHFYITETTKEG